MSVGIVVEEEILFKKVCGLVVFSYLCREFAFFDFFEEWAMMKEPQTTKKKSVKNK